MVQLKPVIRFVTSEEWVEVYVDDTLFDANQSIGRLDVIGLLRKVGCVVQKVEAAKPLKQDKPNQRKPPTVKPETVQRVKERVREMKRNSAKPTPPARRKTKKGA